MIRAMALLLIALLVALTAGTLQPVTPRGGATTLVQNPGFEDVSCSGLPCHWTALAGSITASNTAFSGSKSGQVTTQSAAPSTGTVDSDCIDIELAQKYDVSFYYRLEPTSSATQVALLYAASL